MQGGGEEDDGEKTEDEGEKMEDDGKEMENDGEDGLDGDEADGDDGWIEGVTKRPRGQKKGEENGQGKGREEGVSLSALKNRITLITLFYLKQKCVKK